MRPAEFDYSRPSTLAEALQATHHGAVPLAGGQTLLPALRQRELQPAALVDLACVSELSSELHWLSNRLTIGALVTHQTLASDTRVAAELPWLAEAARQLGDVQVRNRGTTLGNVCWADPRANMLVALMASHAEVVIQDAVGKLPRRLSLQDFATGFRRNALAGGIATAIEVPLGYGRGVYLEFSRQRQDLALVNVCVVQGRGTPRAVIGGLHDVPVSLPAVDTALADPVRPGLEGLVAALDAAALATPSDLHGNAAYRRHLAAVLLQRAHARLAEEFAS